MKIEYNKEAKKFLLTMDNPSLTGALKVNYTINCCSGELLNLSPPIVFKAVVYKTYTLGSININTITINGNTYNCVAHDTCFDFNTFLNNLYPGATYNIVDSTTTVTYEFRGIPANSVISFSMTKGTTIYPIISEVIPVYEIAMDANDGIYKFNAEKQIGNVLVKETGCFFKDDDILCILPKHVIDYPNTEAHLIYETIKHGTSCDCNCNDLCVLYKALAIELNILDKCKTC